MLCKNRGWDGAPLFLSLDLYGAGMWEHFWVTLWSRRVLVTVFSSHSVQTPKASLSLAFDLQCRKRGWGKFVSSLSPHFGWQRGMPCPHCTGGLFHTAILAPSYIPGTTRTFSLTRSKVLGPGEAAGHGCEIPSNSARLTLSCSTTHPCQPAPSQPSRGPSKGWPRLVTPAQHLMG